MTKLEFWHEYKRLNEKYPSCYPVTKDNSTIVLLFDLVKRMDKRWFARVVARVILQNKPDFDFRAAVMGEIKAINDIQRTSELLLEKPNISDGYLEKYLDKKGYSSLLDALESRYKED